jgi:hypothetical protein
MVVAMLVYLQHLILCHHQVAVLDKAVVETIMVVLLAVQVAEKLQTHQEHLLETQVDILQPKELPVVKVVHLMVQAAVAVVLQLLAVMVLLVQVVQAVKVVMVLLLILIGVLLLQLVKILQEQDGMQVAVAVEV